MKIETNYENQRLYLLEAIDFFAQNLSFEQIVSYGYQYVHELLLLEGSGIFVLEEDAFVLRSSMSAHFKHNRFENTALLKTVATKYGRCMQGNLKTYFEEDFINEEEITLAIPIISKDKTMALILSKSKLIDLSDKNLALLFNGINQLINKSVESAVNFKDYIEANKVLDRKIFNLLFINQSTKALMSEVRLEKLYVLCIDVIRELTASSVTSFGLYNQQNQAIILKGYKDILLFDEQYCELILIDQSLKPLKTVYHFKDDYKELCQLFKNPDNFKDLKSEYVILLVKEKILGFVTLGKTVSGYEYTMDILMQVESLLSSIYIAINNALHIATVQVQKKEIAEQLESMNQLNDAIKNINSCESIDEITHIALQTIGFDLDISKAMIVLKEKIGYVVRASNGCGSLGSAFKISETFRKLCYDQVYFDAMKSDLSEFIEPALLSEIGERNCFVSVPLSTSELSMNNEPLGFLLVFESLNPLKKSQIFTLETSGNSISPILNQMQNKNEILETYVPNEKELFMRKLDLAFQQRGNYFIDFQVYYKYMEKELFDDIDISIYKDFDINVFDSIVFHISFEPLNQKELFEGYVEPFDLNDFKEQIRHKILLKKPYKIS